MATQYLEKLGIKIIKFDCGHDLWINCQTSIVSIGDAIVLREMQYFELSALELDESSFVLIERQAAANPLGTEAYAGLGGIYFSDSRGARAILK